MAPMKEISSICQEFGVKLIEDCAQAIGAYLDGRPAGSWGDASTFSFYPTKNLGCLGDGGAVAVKDAIVANHLRQLAQYGWNGRYSVEVAGGFNSRIDEIQAAILVHRIENLEEDNKRRRSIVKRYAGALSSQRCMLWKDDSSFVGHLAIMVSATRDADKKALENSGIGTGVHYPITDHQQIAWKNTFADQINPKADLLTSQILTLPCFPKMTEGEVNAVCNALSQLQQ
jgi:dTDP-4-amino-4,6-dideoxygalactose transaminase